MVGKHTCTPMFKAVLFTIYMLFPYQSSAETWKQSKCPSTDEWIKMWYIYTMKYYSVIKECNFAICNNMDGLGLGFPGGSDSKESSCNVGDLSSIPAWGRSPGGGHGNPFHYSCLENPHGHRPGRLQSMGSQRVRHD